MKKQIVLKSPDFFIISLLVQYHLYDNFMISVAIFCIYIGGNSQFSQSVIDYVSLSLKFYRQSARLALDLKAFLLPTISLTPLLMNVP